MNSGRISAFQGPGTAFRVGWGAGDNALLKHSWNTAHTLGQVYPRLPFMEEKPADVGGTREIGQFNSGQVQG